MPQFSASLNLMFCEWPLADRFAAARDAGFEAIELQAPYAMQPDDIAARLAATGLQLVLINAPPGPANGDCGLAALPGRQTEFRAGVEQSLNYALSTGAPNIHILSGAGANCEQETWEMSMRWAAERLAPHGINALVEPLNTIDNPGYFLTDFQWAAAAIARLAQPNLRLQFDIYHRQMICGSVVAGLRELISITAHVQIAGVPGRHEPDDQEIDYGFVLSELDRLGYSGWVGCEYRPRTGTLQGLHWLPRWRAGNPHRPYR